LRVFVTGIPGSGKSTLAAALADALGWRLVSKDAIKVALWDTFGPGDRQWSYRLGRASIAALQSLVASADEPMVVDNFVGATFADEWTFADAVEVHCVCSPELARTRYVERMRSECHFDTEQVENFDGWVADDAARAPLGPRLDIDTSVAVDVAAVVQWVIRDR
jgi:adenylate kinase family enzyme